MVNTNESHSAPRAGPLPLQLTYTSFIGTCIVINRLHEWDYHSGEVDRAQILHSAAAHLLNELDDTATHDDDTTAYDYGKAGSPQNLQAFATRKFHHNA